MEKSQSSFYSLEYFFIFSISVRSNRTELYQPNFNLLIYHYSLLEYMHRWLINDPDSKLDHEDIKTRDKKEYVFTEWMDISKRISNTYIKKQRNN